MFGKFGIWELIIILVIILLLFGTKKLRNVGGDLGAAMKNFKKAVTDGDKQEEEKPAVEQKDADFEVSAKEKTSAETKEK